MTAQRYKITDDLDDEIELEVDRDVLTLEMAQEINRFWSGQEERRRHEDGDVVRAVVRLFGACAIAHLRQDGCWLNDSDDDELKKRVVLDVLEAQHEGWPDFEHLGIRVVAAIVFGPPDFFDVTLEAQP